MGQLVSDVTTVLGYNDSKKQAENERQKILADMASDAREKTNLVKKHWQPNVPNTVRLGRLAAV